MTAAKTQPNVVFILADDMGYGDFSAFNDGLSSTPVLDQLLDESVCLTQHYSASPVCNPSRAALMTGRYPHRTGSIDTLEWRGLDRLALRETTIADVLKSAGYATGLFGKWHLGTFDPRYHPNARGFDEAVCFRGGMHDYYDWRLDYNDRVVRADGRYLTDVFTDEAVGFIDRHANEPFFLHVTYNAPHTPLQAPESDVRPFADTGRFNRGVSTIYGMLRSMDAGVGRILQALRDNGLDDSTNVMFTSDNGPQLSGEGEDDTTRFNCHFNGAKGTTYEGGVRVPMIVRWPEGLDGGREVGEMVHFCDWFPTLLAMAGLPLPGDRHIDGVDVLPVLRGEGGKVETTRFWQWNRYTPLVGYNAAMRDGDWKLVRPRIEVVVDITDEERGRLHVSMYEPERFIEGGIVGGPGLPSDLPAPPPPELYNIAVDPLERTDLAGTHPERVRTMAARLESWFEDVEADRASITDVW